MARTGRRAVFKAKLSLEGLAKAKKEFLKAELRKRGLAKAVLKAKSSVDGLERAAGQFL